MSDTVCEFDHPHPGQPCGLRAKDPRVPPWANYPRPVLDSYMESELYVAGALSTMAPFAGYHPAWALPFAREALDALGRWEPVDG